MIIQTQALFKTDENLDFEALGLTVEQADDFSEEGDFAFDTKYLATANPSSKKGFTTIRMSCGYDVMIKINYEKLMKLWLSH